MLRVTSKVFCLPFEAMHCTCILSGRLYMRQNGTHGEDIKWVKAEEKDVMIWRVRNKENDLQRRF